MGRSAFLGSRAVHMVSASMSKLSRTGNPFGESGMRSSELGTKGQRGIGRAHGRSRSRCSARASTRRSAYQGPTIWSPMGKPPDDHPHGSETAGWPERLKGHMYGYQAPRSEPAVSPAMEIGSKGSWSSASAGRARVGDMRKSKAWKRAGTRG